MRRWVGVVMLWLVGAGLVCAGKPEESFKEKKFTDLSFTALSDWGEMAMAIQRPKWKHGETEHFIIHFFRNGEQIARRSELFYAEIKEFFSNRPDLLAGKKSQVFAFNAAPDWKQFAGKIKQGWAGGVTRGDEFFYPAASEEGWFDSRGKVQAHEMTHLVFNRLYRDQPPLWLNEGVAEYFSQRKTGTLTQFRQQMSLTPYNLSQLFQAKQYPERPDQITAFYAEAAIVVDFLTHTQERTAKLPKFVDAMIASNDVAAAIQIYGYKNYTEFEVAYKKYRRHF